MMMNIEFTHSPHFVGDWLTKEAFEQFERDVALNPSHRLYDLVVDFMDGSGPFIVIMARETAYGVIWQWHAKHDTQPLWFSNFIWDSGRTMKESA